MKELFTAKNSKGFKSIIIEDVDYLPEVMTALHAVQDPLPLNVSFTNCDYDPSYDIYISPDFDDTDLDRKIWGELFDVAIEILRKSYHYEIISHDTEC